MPAEAPKTMPLKLLELPDGVAEVLEKEGIRDLYPPQAKAAPIALQGKNLFLAVPTASGKSLVAYLAALRMVLTKGRKVLYIVPLRALASEKTEELKRFEVLGLRVGVSVGDLDTPDPDLARYDIIVATSEKADSLLRHGSDWLNAIGLVIADEVHLINDPGRGPTLEVTLSKFRRRDPEMQIIALSATVGNSAEVAEWLQAEHVTSTWRPVKLKEGVYYDERVQFTDNSVKKLAFEGDPIWTLVKDGLADGGQCLIFVNTRKSTESIATKVAKLMPKGEEQDFDIGEEAEGTSLAKTLKFCMGKGVAFHNAGLTNEQRKAVENAFKQRRIRVIVATPTLAAGINLPARRVIIRDVFRYDNGMNVPIPVMEIKQMCGRAGRPRYDPYGEAIVLAKGEEEARFILEEYLLGLPEDVRSKLGNEAVLRAHVLSTIASVERETMGGLMDFLSSTFFAFQSETDQLEATAAKIIEFLLLEGMIKEHEGAYSATFFGRRVSDMYIDPMSAVMMRDALRRFTPGMRGFGFLQAVCGTPDMMTVFLKRGDRPVMEELLADKRAELLKDIPTDEADYEYFLAELKTASILEGWMDEEDEEGLLKRTGIGPGDLRNKVDVAQWLIYSMRELANIFNKDAYPLLTEITVRVKHGARAELMPLLQLKGIGRVRARSLYHKGFVSIDHLKRAPASDIARVIGIGDTLAASLKKQVGDAPPLPGAKAKEREREEKEKAEKRGQTNLFDF